LLIIVAPPASETVGFEVVVVGVVGVLPLDVPELVGVVAPEPPDVVDVPELLEPVDPVEPVELVGGVVVPVLLPDATSKASTQTHVPEDEALFCPVTVMVSVCGPLESPDTV
jgi:hypothetical protein